VARPNHTTATTHKAAPPVRQPHIAESRVISACVDICTHPMRPYIHAQPGCCCQLPHKSTEPAASRVEGLRCATAAAAAAHKAPTTTARMGAHNEPCENDRTLSTASRLQHLIAHPDPAAGHPVLLSRAPAPAATAQRAAASTAATHLEFSQTFVRCDLLPPQAITLLGKPKPPPPALHQHTYMYAPPTLSHASTRCACACTYAFRCAPGVLTRSDISLCALIAPTTASHRPQAQQLCRHGHYHAPDQTPTASNM
jgi:hypothetical protein